MTIENTLERIAVSLERLVDLQAGRNLLLESVALARAEAAEATDAAVEKAATRGRGRPRKTEEPKVEEPAAPVQEVEAEEPAPAAKTKAAEPAPTPAVEETKALVSNAPTVEQLQMRAPALAKKFGGQVSNLVKQINPTKQNISSMTDEMRDALWAALDGLEAGATSNAEFG